MVLDQSKPALGATVCMVSVRNDAVERTDLKANERKFVHVAHRCRHLWVCRSILREISFMCPISHITRHLCRVSANDISSNAEIGDVRVFIFNENVVLQREILVHLSSNSLKNENEQA